MSAKKTPAKKQAAAKPASKPDTTEGAVTPVVPVATPTASIEPPLEMRASNDRAPELDEEKVTETSASVSTFLSARASVYTLALLRQFLPDFPEEDVASILEEVAAGRAVVVADLGEGPVVTRLSAPFFGDGAEADIRANHKGTLLTVVNAQLVNARLHWQL